MEERQVEEKHDEGGRKGTVVRFTRSRSTVVAPPPPSSPVVVPQAPATDQEIADFRRYWPQMKQMLQQFEQMKSAEGCPVMRNILGLDRT